MLPLTIVFIALIFLFIWYRFSFLFVCLFDPSSLDARINAVMPFFWQVEDSGVRIWRYCGIIVGGI